eukprot:CAMPEP_0194553896 /NCGR_PEP_ID=MMETSP0253-20130528/97461_1 /TAXON_ID=2966 /ORGANISM="Noctiluca scintillans" /LENGTH=331 /DNA_ID=CAMNT_0039401379 /DNA_START=284 /DNA_END=1278 /DNA_ORIENTATION=-
MIHLWYGRPRYVLMCITLFIPSTLLCGLADFLPIPVASQMLSSDCTTFTDKFFLQEAYRAAEDLYYECMDALAAKKNMTMEVVRKTHTLDDCTAFNVENSDYAAEWEFLKLEVVRKTHTLDDCTAFNVENSDYAAEWEFLKFMELNNDCKGWCYETDTSLWSINPQPRDVCSKEVGMLTEGTVTSSVNFVLYTGCLGATASVASVYAYEEMFNSLWDTLVSELQTNGDHATVTFCVRSRVVSVGASIRRSPFLLLSLNNDCKGWCYETDSSLWSINPQPRDVCSKEVGMLAKGTVTSSVNFVLFTGCIGAIASVASVYAYEDIFNSYGLPW